MSVNTNILNPQKPGDIRWHDFMYIFDYTVASTVTAGITKGTIVTLNAAGDVVLPPTATSLPNLTQGVFQALNTAPASGKIQLAITGSRIIVTADAGIKAGDRVSLKASAATTPEAWRVIRSPITIATTSGATSNALVDQAYMGRVIEVIADDGTGKKKITAANDAIVVEVGRA